jgi:GNAT superfamily N-acetyltransferase
MSTQIRIATNKDIAALFDIRTSVRENHQSHAGLAAAGITPDSIARMLETTSRAWIAVTDDTPVAFSMANAEEATIFAMFVRPGHEGRGLGARLMRAAEGWLFGAGCSEIWLLTSADPAVRANGFYRHIGWQPDGVQEDGQMKYIRRRGGA